MSRMSAALLAMFLVFQVPGIVQAETPVNIPLIRSFLVKMEGTTQRIFLGGARNAKGEPRIEGFLFEHHVFVPMDPLTGQQTGKRVHQPLTFVKPFDPASIQIFTALTRGERLSRVLFEFVRTDPATRKEVVYATIELQDALVADVRRFTQGRVLLDEVSLFYRKIIIKEPVSNIIVEDAWMVPMQSR